MKITSYGLFWRESEIAWFPGQGAKGFRLLGRIGMKRGNVQIADFRKQQGIYIPYDEYGPNYVGLTKRQGLGKRLKDHKSDDLADTWDRFSWFGFNEIKDGSSDGIKQLSEIEKEVTESSFTTIGVLEALLIRVIGPKNNSSSMKLNGAHEWTQIKSDEIDKYLKKLI